MPMHGYVVDRKVGPGSGHGCVNGSQAHYLNRGNVTIARNECGVAICPRYPHGSPNSYSNTTLGEPPPLARLGAAQLMLKNLAIHGALVLQFTNCSTSA